jgi:uncharacterized protein
MIIGRIPEKEALERYLQKAQSQFIVVYGRRRVGKTFLIKRYFNEQFTFYCTGLARGNKQQQLINFSHALRQYFPAFNESVAVENWYTAFAALQKYLSTTSVQGKKIIFLDELPWMDTAGADFLTGLEFFWNSWASGQKDIFLVVCGSATSWMVSHLFTSKGGLYNRVTGKLKLEPFTLGETKAFFDTNGFQYNHQQCAEAYMVFGGIPFYLEQFDKALSPAQNIDRLCFGTDAFFKDEYHLLYKSLFKKHEKYLQVVAAIGTKNKGIIREEIKATIDLSDGGSLTKILIELEENGFIRKYGALSKKAKGALFQLVDFFSLFYRNMQPHLAKPTYWLSNYQSPSYAAMMGYAFEILCFTHVAQIKKALGIAGIMSNEASWNNAHAQIDMVIERADQVINIIEAKYSNAPYLITKKYDMELRNKINEFQQDTATRKAIWLVMVTTYGLKDSPYNGLVHSQIKLDALFA